MTDLPEAWWGHCPMCGVESKHERDTDQTCGRCGFDFRVTEWA